MGKTSIVKFRREPKEKHPHVHGEDDLTVFGDNTEIETPPRAWGRLVGPKNLRLASRNTPTCMGKTVHCRQWRKEFRKHPHVHGEDRD